MRVLITGGAGFIGSHVTERLLNRGDEVICLDNFNDYYDPRRKRRNVAPFLDRVGYTLLEGDIRSLDDLQAAFATGTIDKVLHIAAMAGVRYSIQRPELYAAVNVTGTTNVLDMACKHNVRNFVFASSSSVYGARSEAPFRESEPVECPISPYAATKRAAELLTYTYHHLYGLSCTSLRFFTVYGPKGRPDMAPYLFTSRIFEGKELTMFGDGSSRRDYTYIDDMVDGIYRLMQSDTDQPANIGCPQYVTVRQLVDAVAAAAGKAIRVRSVPGPVGVQSRNFSNGRIYGTGWRSRFDLEAGIARTYPWILKQVRKAARASGRA